MMGVYIFHAISSGSRCRQTVFIHFQRLAHQKKSKTNKKFLRRELKVRRKKNDIYTERQSCVRMFDCSMSFTFVNARMEQVASEKKQRQRESLRKYNKCFISLICCTCYTFSNSRFFDRHQNYAAFDKSINLCTNKGNSINR